MPTPKNFPSQKPSGLPRAMQPKPAAKLLKPPACRPQPTPKVLQRREATPAPRPAPAPARPPLPTAPAPYRPQPTPKVLQQKRAVPPAPAPPQAPASARAPQAPQPFRPDPAPRVLQRKGPPGVPRAAQAGPPAAPAARQTPPVAGQTPSAPRVLQRQTPPGRPAPLAARGVVQRFAWAIHNSSDPGGEAIVNENVRRASGRYVLPETVTDPELVDEPRRPLLGGGEPIHIHAHGNDESVGGFASDSFAAQLFRKFDAADLVGRTIVFHSCDSGQGNYARDVLQSLVELAQAEDIRLVGTQILAPTRYLVVEKNGFSYVSKNNVDPGDLRVDNRSDKLQQFGKGWRGWEVSRYGVVTVMGANAVEGAVARALNFQEERGEGRYKPPKPKQERARTYGYYDDPNTHLTRHEESLLSRALSQGTYPPRY